MSAKRPQACFADRQESSAGSASCVESALFFGRPFWAAPRYESETIMVTIRLTRRGARNQPFYHVVVTDSRKRQGGPSLEHVGFFNPIARKGEQKLELDLP